MIYVEWIDALSRDGWINAEDTEAWFKDIDMVCDVGFLIIKTKEYIVLAQSYSSATEQYGYLKKIPLSSIKKEKYYEKNL